MAVITWDDVADRSYETGVDRGIIYVQDKDVAPWNGLISVVENEVGLVIEQNKFDGVTYSNLALGGSYQCNIVTFNFPDYVDECIGNYVVFPGVTLTGQQRVTFEFSYRTMINETDYKLHLVYGCLASIKSRGTKTMADGVDPETYEFVVTAKAPVSDSFKRTSHICIDSRKANPADLAELEDMLYGTDDDPGVFPAQSDLIAIFA